MGSLFSKKSVTIETPQDHIIEKYVEQILQNKTTNLDLIPDALERKLYRIVFTILIHELMSTLPKSRLVLFDHLITFQVEPLPETKP